MSLFGHDISARIIAKAFYKADCVTRREIVNREIITESSERDMVSNICTRIRDKMRNPFMSSLSIKAHPHGRDTQQRDALFVFRYKNTVKAGIFEAKYLRIDNQPMTKIWDQVQPHAQNSHFTNQVINQQQWIPAMFVWDMFMPNCPIGAHSPSLDAEGSSCIWADEMINHPNIQNPTKLWDFNDMLTATPQYLSLYDIVYEILSCKKGIKHEIDSGTKTVNVKSNMDRRMDIPVPTQYGWGKDIYSRVREFLIEHNLLQYNYYNFLNPKQLDEFWTANPIE